MQAIQRRIRAFLPVLCVAAAAYAPGAWAADCPATTEATFLACASAGGAGDTITLGADVTLTGATPAQFNADQTLVQGAFRLSGTLKKTGPAALTITAANSVTVVEVAAGTIFVSATNALGSGALVMSGGQLISTANTSFSFMSLDFTAGTRSVISADTNQSIGLFATSVTLASGSQAVFGDPGRHGGVFLSPGASSSAAADSTILIDGASFTAGSPSFGLLSDAAASVTIQSSGGISTNGNSFSIGNLQAPTIFGSLGLAVTSTVTVRSGNFMASLGGTGTLVKAGPGTLVLSGQILHTGGTNITGGTLQIGDGSGTNQNYNLSITNDATLAFNTAAANFTVGGTISGSGSVVKNGPGAVNLNTASSYFGDTTINGGTLRIGSPGAIGNGPNLNVNSGRLQATNSMVITRNVVIGPASTPAFCASVGQTLTLAGPINNGTTGQILFNDCAPGTVVLAGPTSGIPPSLQVIGGEVQVNDGFSGSLFTGSTQVLPAGTLRVNRATTPLQVTNLTGPGSVVVEQNLLELNGGTFDGVISGAGGLRTVVAAVTLRGNNTYSGPTEIQTSTTVGDGASSGTLGSGPITTFVFLTYNRADALEIPNVLNGNGSLQFSGGGEFTLSGSGTINANFRPSPNATVVVTGTFPTARPQLNGAGAILRGTGTVQGFLASTGAYVEPGVGTGTGILTVGQPSLLGGQVGIKIGGPTAGTQYDQLQVSSFASFSATPLSVIVIGGYVPPPGTSFMLVEVATGSTPASFVGLPEGGLLATGPFNFRISYQGGNGNDIVLTAVSVPDAPTITTATLLTPTDVQVFFTAGFDGGTPITSYEVQCGTTTITGVLASPATVPGLPAGPTTCVVRALNAVGRSADSAPFAVTPGSFSFSGPSATGSGTITAMVSGGGSGCSFGFPPSFVPVSMVPDTPPANVDFPHGLAGLYASGCTPGSTITFTVIFPAPLPAGTVYWAYGPTTAIPAAHWYVLPPSVAMISGNTVTLTVTDNASEDFEPTAGTIALAGGPGVPHAIPAPPPPPVALANAYQALWWAGSAESGWGVNTTHQGNILFATWFTYGADGEGQWFVMSDAERTGPGVFTGKIHTTRGPAFNAVPFDPRQVVVTEVGTGTFTFTSATSGRFDYTVNGITQTKALVREEFGNAIPECTAGGPAGAIVNYQDLWWKASESGWGLNITHQGDVIFATWFTYDTNGKPQWLVMSNVRRVGLGDSFTGSIYRTRGNPFNTLPWNVGSIQVTEVGKVTLTFSDRDHGMFAYTLDGVSQVKDITRQEFASPKAMCSFR